MIRLALLWFFLATSETFAQHSAQLTGVQMGMDVSPDTVTVGERFVVTVRVKAPAGSAVEFPDRPADTLFMDTARAVVRKDTVVGGHIESTVAYLLTAWRPGTHSLGLPAARVKLNGAERSIPLSSASVHVRSVLPTGEGSDTAPRIPRPLRPRLEGKSFPWLWLLAALALAGLVWWIWHRYTRSRDREKSAYEWAVEQFSHIDSLGLLERNQFARYAELMSGVMRDYLSREFDQAARSRTTRELYHALEDVSAVQRDSTIELLEHVDLIKFAGVSVDSDTARTIGSRSVSVVDDVNTARMAERQAEGRKDSQEAA